MAISVASLVYFLSFGEGARRLIRKSVEDFNLQILVLPPAQSLTVQPLLPRSLADSIRSLGIGKVYSILRLPYTAGFPPRAMGVVFGRDFSSSLRFISRYEVVRGRDLRDSTVREAVVGEALAKALGWDVGDTLTVGTGRYVVVGVVKAGSPMVDNAVIVPLNLLMEDMGTDRLLAVAVAPPPGKTEEVLSLLKREFPGYTIQTSEELVKLAKSFVALGDAIRFGLSSIALFVTAVLLFAIMAITVQERRWEFAVLRALGATRWFIFRLVLAQALTVSFVGWIFGASLGWGLAEVTSRVTVEKFGLDMVEVSPSILLLALLVALGVGLVGSLFPALSAVRMDIREGLGR